MGINFVLKLNNNQPGMSFSSIYQTSQNPVNQNTLHSPLKLKILQVHKYCKMGTVAKNLVKPITRASASISKATDDHLPFIPFSQLQKIKQLEYQVISTLEDCRDLAQIKQTHAYIIRRCLHQSSFITTKLIRMLSQVNISIRPYGVSIFSQVRYPNDFLYTALIRGYLNDGMLRESVLVYNSMRRDGGTPLSFTFSALLKGSTSELDVDLGRQLHGQMVKLGGFGLDLFLLNTLVGMYAKCGWLDYGRKVFDEMPERDSISWTLLIDACIKAGDVDSASELFESLPQKDMVAWTTMVIGFAQNAMPKEALQYFKKMQSAGVQADGVTLVGVINACAQLGAVKYANWVRDLAESSGFGPASDVHVGSALIDMYSKCGCLEEACKVFEEMPEKNVYSYSSMICGFAMHGLANSAIKLFEEMMKTDVKPNYVTFVGVLTACSHGGLIEQGRHFFETMESLYGVKRTIDHYNCMVDLLGRTGQLEEALNLIKSMPVEPTAGIWGALLGACRVYANPDVAEVAASHLFKLEPTNVGNYIVLCDIYGKAERWEDVLEVRKLVRTEGMKKTPAFSRFEGDKGEIHEFYAGGTPHPRFQEINETLQDLIDRLTISGYQPDLSSVVYNVEDDEKRRILMNHSEKLALAYALLSTDDGSAIRIVKNLRICEDCHTFMCIASEVTEREIIVRDTMRFHHFHQGSCSCSNFW